MQQKYLTYDWLYPRFISAPWIFSLTISQFFDNDNISFLVFAQTKFIYTVYF